MDRASPAQHDSLKLNALRAIVIPDYEYLVDMLTSVLGDLRSDHAFTNAYRHPESHRRKAVFSIILAQIEVLQFRKGPSPVLMGEHLPCTATAVLEDAMQNCSLIRKSRKRGPDVWLLRWSDKSISGKRIYRKRAIGTVEEYPDSESARRAVASLIATINVANPRIGLSSTTLSQLSNHFERIEFAPDDTWRSYSTKRCYAGYLKRWIVPQWGTYELRNIKTIEVQSWLRRLPLAKSSCAKIRGVMPVLFNHAGLYELVDRNPIYLVRQGAKRQ